MWDYNIGIVRITHLFKCNGYSKVSVLEEPTLRYIITLKLILAVDHTGKDARPE